MEIVDLLRSPGGCPWDREQTHSSIRNNLIEEAYEVVDTIDREDRTGLCEELGDLLLQVVFHSQMESEQDTFTFDDVCDGICKKLVHRHPHVFSDVKAETSSEVLANWDAIKKEEKKQRTQTDSMNSIPRCFPALMRAEKIQKKASKVGFDWNDVSGPLEKLHEETLELQEAFNKGDEADITEELGDVLFAAVNVARFTANDAELTLTKATDKFVARFALVEQLAAERGIDMNAASLDELDRIWDEVKHR